MLRSIAASSSWRSPVIAVKQASEITLATLRVNNWELVLISFPMSWVEGHISHTNRELRRCHLEQSFDCYLFIKYRPWAVCFLLVAWKKTCVFLWAIIWPDSLKISLSDSVWRLKNFRQKCQTLPYEQLQFVNHCKLWTLKVCHLDSSNLV